VYDWHVLSSNIGSLYNYTGFNTHNFSSEIKQTATDLSADDKKHYISTHIWYTLDGKNILYNSAIIWKSNYSQWTLLESGSNLWAKVLWNVQSKNQVDISEDQTWTSIIQIWNNTKADLREQIYKNVAEISMNITPKRVAKITNISWNQWSDTIDAPKVSQKTILLTQGNIEIEAAGTYWGSKTIVVTWWDVYISQNIIAQNRVKDILGIIVLSDENGNGWNVYIDPSVTAIEAIIYSDKSLLNYNWTSVVTDGTQLKNQFYFYGTLFSENTLWGYVAQLCPYYIENCTFQEAEKYDLNFLRSYYTYDSDGDGNEDDASGDSYFSYPNENFQYPVIFEYNSMIQSNPPELFEISY